jgi:diaminopimelate epimerase
MKISFTKAHGTRNDFLLTWASEAPLDNQEAAARAICDRHSGVGADGWILVSLAGEDSGCDAEIRLFNADGSHAEISGNGTRCAAAFLAEPGLVPDPVRIRTQAGLRELRLVSRDRRLFSFEMDMGRPEWREEEIHFRLPLRHGEQEVTLLDTGNPQCAVFVKDHDFDWRGLGAEIEAHPRFPNRTNVSFVRVLDEHTLDVRFFERGAGETMSSGTGSTGAVWAASLQGLVRSPVRVLTPGGPLELRWDRSIFLTGPAEIIGRGEFYFM